MNKYVRIVLPAIVVLLIAVTFGIVEKTDKIDVSQSIDKMKQAAKTDKTGEISAPNTIVDMETNYGTIKIELFNSKAPVCVDNFLNYVESFEYDSTIFHRVISNFMIQGGGFDKDLNKKPSKFAPILNEAPISQLRNSRGTLAMARTNDPNSATNQFFINLNNNQFLDWDKSKDNYGYAVFGKVIEGMNIVDSIGVAKTSNKGSMQNVPVETVIITKMKIVK